MKKYPEIRYNCRKIWNTYKDIVINKKDLETKKMFFEAEIDHLKKELQGKQIYLKEVRNNTPKHYSRPDPIINHMNTTELKNRLKIILGMK